MYLLLHFLLSKLVSSSYMLPTMISLHRSSRAWPITTSQDNDENPKLTWKCMRQLFFPTCGGELIFQVLSKLLKSRLSADTACTERKKMPCTTHLSFWYVWFILDFMPIFVGSCPLEWGTANFDFQLCKLRPINSSKFVFFSRPAFCFKKKLGTWSRHARTYTTSSSVWLCNNLKIYWYFWQSLMHQVVNVKAFLEKLLKLSVYFRAETNTLSTRTTW